MDHLNGVLYVDRMDTRTFRRVGGCTSVLLFYYKRGILVSTLCFQMGQLAPPLQPGGQAVRALAPRAPGGAVHVEFEFS
jgi:hypothetical protein